MSRTPSLLRQFVLDLQSGKLHREFHNGPDPVISIGQVSGCSVVGSNDVMVVMVVVVVVMAVVVVMVMVMVMML